MFKLALDNISHPSSVAVLGSVGVHILLGVSLPILPIFSQGTKGPTEVPIVELTPEEMARIPSLQPSPNIAFVPPNATQLLPLPKNFELPSVSGATPSIPATPALPAQPSAGVSPYNYPNFSTPQQVITRRRLLPGRPTGDGAIAGRSVASAGDLVGNRRRTVVSDPQGERFKVNPDARPEETLNASLRGAIRQGQVHENNQEIAQLESENDAKGSAEAQSENLEPNTEQRSTTPDTPENQSQETRDSDAPQTPENERQQTPQERETTETNNDSPRETRDRNEPSTTEQRAPQNESPRERNRTDEGETSQPPPRRRSEIQERNPARIEGNQRRPEEQQQQTETPQRRPEEQQQQTETPQRRQGQRDRAPAETSTSQSSETQTRPTSPSPEVRKKDKPAEEESSESSGAQ